MSRKRLKTTTTSSEGTSSFIELDNVTSPRQCIGQNFLCIWVDFNHDESDDNYRENITQLRRFVNTIITFTDLDQCVDFLTDITDEKVFMIMPTAIGEHLIPLIHTVPQLNAIYIFCDNASDYREWSKVKGVYAQILSVCESIRKAVKQCDESLMPISFISTTHEAKNQNLEQLDASFMYTQIFKEILFEIEYGQHSIIDFANYCRNGNYGSMNNIDKLEHEYDSHSPIWWYTYPSFIYSMLNRALRTLEVNTLMKMSFFIRDLHCQIEKLHTEQFGHPNTLPFSVYRGQELSKSDFEKLIKTKGGLMSFNNFLSTSKNRDIALVFAEGALTESDSMSVLFTMKVEPSISLVPFALTDNVSYYGAEEEILFSMHTIFRISEIKQIENSDRLWEVELQLTSDNDPELCILTERIRWETKGSIGWDRLGLLLIRLKQFDRAAEVYQILLHAASDESYQAFCYNQLGIIKNHESDYTNAILFHEKSLEINQKLLPPDHSTLATINNNIGSIYIAIEEYGKGLLFFEKTKSIWEKILATNHPNLATCYNNIGSAYDKLGKYFEALTFYERTMYIWEKTLPLNHPDLATCYSNIGLMYMRIGTYSKALSFLEKALVIREKILPKNHPDLACSYCNIGLVRNKMGEYSKALLSQQKALDIRQKILSQEHPDLATSYNNIGVVHDNMSEYPTALSFFKKALEINLIIFPSYHSSVAVCYNNMGLVCDKMREYSTALLFYDRAKDIFEKILPSNHPDLSTCCGNIGSVYVQMGEYSKALLFYEKDLEICRNSLPPNHPDLITSYNNIGFLYHKLGEYARATSAYKRALTIAQEALPPNHPHCLSLRDKIEHIERNCQ